MYMKWQWFVCLSFVAVMCFVPQICEPAETVNLRFPVLYNPNALAGRLYLQPLEVHDDSVTKGWTVSFDVGSATDYNVYFKEYDGDEELTANYNVFSFALSKDVTIASQAVELGAILRINQDKKNTILADLTESYHGMFSDGFGKTPPDGQYYGEVGNNQTRIIADSGDVFLSTLQLSGKYQLWEDKGLGTLRPNVTLKISGRIPLSSKDFDTAGIALSLGFSKEVLRQFYLIGAGGLIYQDLSQEDFNADNLDVEKFAIDCFAGSIWDLGKQNDWYLQLGTRWSSERISYSTNPESAESSWNVLLGISYRVVRENGDLVDLFLNFTEDIPGFSHGLDPDFGVYGGFSFYL